MREPAFQGHAGRAWLIPNPPEASPEPAWAASVASYLVEAHGYHPMWSRWTVSVVSLRDIPGVKPAHKQFPEATHEFLIMALDPDHYAAHAEGLPPKDGFRFLTPADVIEQFTVPADQFAARICELAVRSICDGLRSPDQDWRAVWKETIATTAAHLREGRHGIG